MSFSVILALNYFSESKQKNHLHKKSTQFSFLRELCKSSLEDKLSMIDIALLIILICYYNLFSNTQHEKQHRGKLFFNRIYENISCFKIAWILFNTVFTIF